MSTDSNEARETLSDATTGAIVSVVDSAKKPRRTARSSVRRLARKGDPVNTQLRRRATRTTNEVAAAAADVVSGNLAERMALQGIRILKDRARRQDMVGDVLNRGLEVISTALDGTARELGKFREATQPAVRNGERRSATTRRSSASRAPSTRARRATTTATKRAGTSARRATNRTRSAARTAARRVS